MKKTVICLATASLMALPLQAQNDTKDAKAFSHLDLSVTMGTTGIGLDLATPIISDILQVRTGIEVMPHIEKRLHFDIQSFDVNGKVMETKFDKMADLLEQFTGYRADPQVDMVCKPTYWNFKLLFDVFPFRNKHWHLTAGFHWGPSKIGEAINSLEDVPSLMAVNIYNNIYDQAIQGLPIYQDFTLTGDQRRKLRDEYGRMGIRMGTYKNLYLTDVEFDDDGNEMEVFRLDENGNKIPMTYTMVPDKDCTVSAKAYVNSFKPYLGFGYGGNLSRKDDRYKISFDAGVMFWGGTPDIITHDGVNLSKDVTDIGGKVGRYVDLISGVKAFPVLNVRITRRLF